MPSSDTTSLDDLISYIVAGLHASQSLRMAEVEKLMEMSLLLLGRSIAQPKAKKHKSQTEASGRSRADAVGDPKVKKPRAKKMQQQEAAEMNKISLIVDSSREALSAVPPYRSDMSAFQHRPAQSASPRRRPPTRRTGSRG